MEAVSKGTDKPGTGDTKPQGKGMYVKNGKLYDGNGNEFLMRGVNVAHAWYTGKTETSTCIDNCQSVASADTTGNTMFSIHMYSVAGKDADTVKSNIDGMLSKGVAFQHPRWHIH